MVRAFTIFSMALLFLSISAKLRGNVQECIGSVYVGVQLYAPYSYVAGILLVIAALIVSFNRGSQPR